MSKVKISCRKAFTLVELVVVVLILGILASVAAPKMFDSAGNARQSGTRQSLVVIRDAIDLYKSQSPTSVYPPHATFATALRPYLKGSLAEVQVGANQNATINLSTETPLVTPTGTDGWIYNETTGEFNVNEAPFITTW